MNKNEIIEILENNRNWLIEKTFKNKFPDIYKDVLNYEFPKEFCFSQKLYHYLYNDLKTKLGICPECGKRCWFTSFKKGYQKYCSQKCSANSKEVKEKTKNTFRKKYGCDYALQSKEVKEKSKKTCLKKYGVHHAGAAKECIEKRHKTCEEKYGAISPFSNKNVQEKIKETNLEKYGVENVFQNKEIQEKIENTMVEKYGVKRALEKKEFIEKSKQTCLKNNGVKSPFQLESSRKKLIKTKADNLLKKFPDIIEWLSDNSLKAKCDIPNCKCGGTYVIKNYMFFRRKKLGHICCPFSNPISSNISQLETQIFNHISEIYTDKIIRNDKKILDGKEIDIYFPKLNIGFEINGDYWHMNPMFHGENEILEQTKTTAKEIWERDKYKIELAKSKNIDLYVIWENDWLNNNEKTKEMIKNTIHEKIT